MLRQHRIVLLLVGGPFQYENGVAVRWSTPIPGEAAATPSLLDAPAAYSSCGGGFPFVRNQGDPKRSTPLTLSVAPTATGLRHHLRRDSASPAVVRSPSDPAPPVGLVSNTNVGSQKPQISRAGAPPGVRRVQIPHGFLPFSACLAIELPGFLTALLTHSAVSSLIGLARPDRFQKRPMYRQALTLSQLP